MELIETDGLASAVEVAAAHPLASSGLVVLTPLWRFDPHEDHVARAAREEPEWLVRSEPAPAASST
ncbi:hypothetical protein [Micropruina sonneratiae]|uniref:hypothetical protein n=1 Tax=Micropruina sonneratiae TaxID=2986940 RepID=UPI002227241E|nr:hypothetical protein [Micropruina sp. KQZ13P-5]MCW3157409.1 hypothetical protein [Micropruina sp. KQZ13P-5]